MFSEFVLGVLFASLTVGALSTSASSDNMSLQMVDPLFGVSYDPQRVKFQLAPVSVKTKCKLDFMQTVWVFADWATGPTHYYILSGFDIVEPDAPKGVKVKPELEANETGVVVALQDDRCERGTPETAMNGEVVKTKRFTTVYLSEDARKHLASSAMYRYSMAFEGGEKFLNAIGYPKIDKLNLPPALRDAVLNLASSKRK